MRTVSLKLPEALYGGLTSLAERRGLSRSALIRTALREFFERERESVRDSALRQLEDLVGCVDGPEDLSSNKAYLDDLGR